MRSASSKSERLVLTLRLTLLAGAGVCLLTFHLVNTAIVHGFEFGSTNSPRAGYITLTSFWALFGGLAAVLLTCNFVLGLRSQRGIDHLLVQWRAVSDRTFLGASCAAAIAIPIALRALVLQHAPLTDDEGAYRFAAQLFASGRLWTESPPMKLFFDQNFVINDGRFYIPYFPGWPAILSLGVLAGHPDLVNPIVSAVTIPPLYEILRRAAGTAWARLGIVLFLCCPLIQIGAATELSHTSCLAAVTWALASCFRTREQHPKWHGHAALAFWLSLAFCIRPQVAVAFGLPMVIVWIAAIVRLPKESKRHALIAFAIPSAALATVFLVSLWAQNGSPFRTGYSEYNRYVADNDFKFTTFQQSDFNAIPGFNVSGATGRLASGLYRLNFDVFGWPTSFAFLAFAAARLDGTSRLVWWMVGSFLLMTTFQSDWGVDTFGPVHAFELALPLIVLTIHGAQRLSGLLSRREVSSIPGRVRWEAFPAALIAMLIMTSLVGLIPLRLGAIHRIASHLSVALKAPENARAHHAIVFAPWPFAPPCDGVPTHFVFFRPLNDPDFQNDVLWANHIDVAQDRELAARLGGRTPYLLRWTDSCQIEFQSLAEVNPSDIPAGPIRRRDWSSFGRN